MHNALCIIMHYALCIMHYALQILQYADDQVTRWTGGNMNRSQVDQIPQVIECPGGQVSLTLCCLAIWIWHMAYGM